MSDWRADAACKGMDPNLFFPERGDTTSIRAAKAVCAGCEVREQCITYAVENGEDVGVWGGLTHRDIREERRRRKLRRTPSIELQPCGTPAAYARHVRKGELCVECRRAHALAQQWRKQARHDGDGAA